MRGFDIFCRKRIVNMKNKIYNRKGIESGSMYQRALDFFESFVHQYPIDEKDTSLESYYFKYRHTFDVVKRMEELVSDKTEKELYLTVALFHDLGRFVQLEKYKYYNDVKTKFDHAKESVLILEEYEWFNKNNIPKETQEIIEFAILNHNKIAVEPCKGLKKELTETLRDADKIGVLDRMYDNTSDIGQVSDDVFKDFHKEKLIPYTLVKTGIDGILAEIAFVFDLKKKKSIKIIKKEQILNSRLELLKNSKYYKGILMTLENYFQTMV